MVGQFSVPIDKPPKTASSVRRVDLPPETMTMLRSAKGLQAEQKLMLGGAYQNNDLVCCHVDGQPFRPDHVSYHFRLILKRANLPHVRFHDLRHSHATWLLKSGVHPKVVQERLGHGTISITLDTYSHVLPSMQEEAARKIGNLLRGALSE
jgi:integrase